jgi:uncharacterized protein
MNDAFPGPPRSGLYLAQTPWRPWWAGFAAIVIVTVSFAMAAAALVLFTLTAGDGALHGPRTPAHWSGWAPLLVSQAAMAGGAVWLSGWFGGNRARTLALSDTVPPVRDLVVWFLGLAVVSFAYTVVIFLIRPEVVRADLELFLPLARGSEWPVYALIIVMGAPLSEELLFRGFLQPALAQSRLGFIGASLVTTTAWTALHIQYSVFGLAEIFAVGLVFCWLLWRTGSLWSPIILHALYNGTQFVGMRFGLFPWT